MRSYSESMENRIVALGFGVLSVELQLPPHRPHLHILLVNLLQQPLELGQRYPDHFVHCVLPGGLRTHIHVLGPHLHLAPLVLDLQPLLLRRRPLPRPLPSPPPLFVPSLALQQVSVRVLNGTGLLTLLPPRPRVFLIVVLDRVFFMRLQVGVELVVLEEEIAFILEEGPGHLEGIDGDFLIGFDIDGGGVLSGGEGLGEGFFGGCLFDALPALHIIYHQQLLTAYMEQAE